MWRLKTGQRPEQTGEKFLAEMEACNAAYIERCQFSSTAAPFKFLLFE